MSFSFKKINYNSKLFFLTLLIFSFIIRFLYLSVGLKNFTINGDEATNFLQAKEIANGVKSLLFWGQPYQFPIEAYLMSFFYPLLEWNTFGVRIIPFLICLLSFFIFLLLFKKIGNFKETWPGVLLLLFPSTYSLLRQTILFTPQHSITLLFSALCPLMIWYVKNSRYPKSFSFLGGLFAGLAVSNHLLAASIVLLTTLAICFARSFKTAVRNTIYYTLGILLGLSPYIYVKLYIPGAYQKVAERYPWHESFDQLWNPILNTLIPEAIGINTIFYPDVGPTVDTFNYFIPAFSILFSFILIFLTIKSFSKFIKRLRTDYWPSFTLEDVFLGTTIVALILLSITKMTLRPRYALFIVWCFPFLFFFFYRSFEGILKKVVIIFAVLLIFINLISAKEVYAFWNRKNVSHKDAFMPKLDPLLKFFKKQGITHCYSGWWLAYQINVSTKENTICSPPFNDRFLGWAQPYYRKLVDLEFNSALVEGVYQHRWLKSKTIMNVLAAERLSAKKTKVGKFSVIHEIGNIDIDKPNIINVSELSIENSSFSNDISPVIDNNLLSSWESEEKQSKNQFIEIELKNPKKIHGIRFLSEASKPTKELPKVNIIIFNQNKRKVVKENHYGAIYPLKLDKKYPRFAFEGSQLYLGFKPTLASKIRIEISTAKTNSKWKLSEVQVFS